MSYGSPTRHARTTSGETGCKTAARQRRDWLRDWLRERLRDGGETAASRQRDGCETMARQRRDRLRDRRKINFCSKRIFLKHIVLSRISFAKQHFWKIKMKVRNFLLYVWC